jgi:UDP:flavonoid glycosyltransferase YjiC (YdhE family)
MRIAIVCNDTRGGVQPYVALGAGLARAGHDVRAVAPEDLAPMFARAGLSVAALPGSLEEVLRRSGGAAEKGTLAAMRLAARELPARIETWTRVTLEACEGADVVTGGVGGMVLGLAVAERLGRPFVETHLQPLSVPPSTCPGVLFPRTPAWLGAPGRWASHRLTELAVWGPFRGAMGRAREKVLGLRGAPAPSRGPILYGFSRHVLDVPAAPDRERHVTGYWFLPAASDWTPSPALEAFLAREGPVVSIGFGSMASEDPAATTRTVRAALRRAGVRAVLLSGWGGLSAEADGAADDVFVADAMPHDWLFPRVAAIVHHGGAGTTGAAARAGVPAIVVPFTMDQPFWGARVAELGVGPAPIPRPRLSAERLGDALSRALGDAAMRSRAAALGDAIRAEDGVAAAVARLGALGPG